MNITDKYLQMAESEQGNYEDFRRLAGAVRGIAVQGSPSAIVAQSVPGDVPVSAIVGNISFSITRTLVAGPAPINANLPVLFGSGFAAQSGFQFYAKKMVASNVLLTGVTINSYSNSIIYSFSEGVNAEEIRITSENYNVIQFQNALVNIKAVCERIRTALPTNDLSRLNAWKRSGLVKFSTSWLSNFNQEPISVSTAPGQYNASIFDTILPVVLSNVEGFAVYVPALPSNATSGTSESTDVTIFLNRIEKI